MPPPKQTWNQKTCLTTAWHWFEMVSDWFRTQARPSKNLDLQGTQSNGPICQNRESRQYRVHYFGAILPMLSVLGYWASILGTLEVQESSGVLILKHRCMKLEARLCEAPTTLSCRNPGRKISAALAPYSKYPASSAAKL